jgi:addiction module RelE/StbE family toxin
MQIYFSKEFEKNFKKRITGNKNLENRFFERLEFFKNNKNHPLLKNHPLKGKRASYYAFSVTADTRVIYQQAENKVYKFIDIGTHNQVY